ELEIMRGQCQEWLARGRENRRLRVFDAGGRRAGPASRTIATHLPTVSVICNFPIALVRQRGEQPMRIALTIIAALLLLPTAAFAHPAIGDAHGFVQGLAHPLGGFDHILAMVAVGVFAWQLGGRALWAVPTTFVLVMALGGILGITGVAVPGVEIGIAASVIVLGAIVAFRVKASVALAMGVVAVFAIFHGHAHGTEMPLAAA